MNRNRTIIIVSTLLALGVSTARTQGESPKSLQAPNTVYVELGGKGVLFGLYYERLLLQRLGVSVGFTSWNIYFFGSIDVTIIPLYLTWYPIGEKHHLYIDAGMDFVRLSAEIGPFGTLKGSGTVPVLGTGYCIRNSTGGLYYKIGPMWFFGNGETRVWAGMSAGVTF